MTSVKEVRVTEPPTADSLGRGSFHFTDAYSVFDWGRMPDEIPDKGAALCAMGASTFDHLEAAGVPTHYRGVGGGDEPVALSAALESGAPTEMAIDLAQVPDLPVEGGEYDYRAYHAAAGDHYLVPLEIVVRNSVGVGSSLRRRTTPADHGLAHERWPAGTVDLATPIVEFSTKFEEQDRYLDRDAAERIAGRAAVADLERVARSVNEVVTELAAEAGLDHLDGKLECLYAGGDVRVADVVGTFDENRFTLDGTQVSKELLRQHHKASQPGWVEAVVAAKERASAEGVADWRGLCDVTPAPLDGPVIEAVSDLYRAGTNAYCDRAVFEAAPPLAAAVATATRVTAAGGN